MLETNNMFRESTINNQKLCSLTDDDFGKIHTILLNMLDDIDALCRKYDLKYMLCGGTALGAVRHKGFIPWDDDVDIALPRSDYDKLAEILRKEYGDRYWLQDIYSNDVYDLTFMKMRKKGTRFVELTETQPEQAGVFIDIFPLENVPDFPLWRWLHGAVCDFLYLCCSCVRIRTKKQRFLAYLDNEKAKRTIKIKAFIGACLGFFSMSKWCRITDKWSSKCHNESSKYVTFPSGRKHYFGEMCTRKSFLPLRNTEFEGRQYSIMTRPEEYLTALYGDYKIILPESKRERHMVLELDLGENYD